jgi:hypothetical protein
VSVRRSRPGTRRPRWRRRIPAAKGHLPASPLRPRVLPAPTGPSGTLIQGACAGRQARTLLGSVGRTRRTQSLRRAPGSRSSARGCRGRWSRTGTPRLGFGELEEGPSKPGPAMAGSSPSSRTRPGMLNGPIQQARRNSTRPSIPSPWLRSEDRRPPPEADRGLCQRVSALGTWNDVDQVIVAGYCCR